MALQRLCYYAWMVAKAEDDRELFDIPPCAWPNGPVFVELHEAFRGGPDTVKPETFAQQGLSPLPLSPENVRLAGIVWQLWGGRSGLNLSNLTKKELPWLEARARSAEGEGAELDIEVAGRFFRALRDAPQNATEYANRFASEYVHPAHVKKPKIEN